MVAWSVALFCTVLWLFVSVATSLMVGRAIAHADRAAAHRSVVDGVVTLVGVPRYA